MVSWANATGLVLHNPSYLLGRFRTVRSGYSAARHIRQMVGGSTRLMLGDIYNPPNIALAIAPSGHLISCRSTAEHVAQLQRNAYSTGLELTPGACADLLSAAKLARLITCGTPRELDYADLAGSPKLRKKLALGTVINSSHNEIIQKLAADAAVVEPIARYLRYVPTKVSSRLFWSFANDLSNSERESQYQTVRFHYDIHGFNFIYVNFYLTRVTIDSGAHVLIAGTHRQKTPRQLWGSARISDQTATSLFGESRIKVMDGSAGTGFFEDTACYHKALPPLTADRLMLQLRYQ